MAPEVVDALLAESAKITDRISVYESAAEKAECDMIETYDQLRKVEADRFTKLARAQALRLVVAQAIMGGEYSPTSGPVETCSQMLHYVQDEVRAAGQQSSALITQLTQQAGERKAARREAERLADALELIAGTRLEA